MNAHSRRRLSTSAAHIRFESGCADFGVKGKGAKAEKMQVDVIDPATDPDWDANVLKHPGANVFHSSAWARVLTATYGHRPIYLRCTAQKRLIALVPCMEAESFLRPRRGVSLPFSDFCDTLLFESCAQDQLFAKACEIAAERHWHHIDFRGSGCVPDSAVPAVTFFAHKLDLRGGTAAVTERFRPSVRQALRKANRNPELSVSIEHSENAMRLFFRLHSLTRGRHGLPPQSLAFFLNIHQEIIAKGLGFIVVVRLNGEAVSAMVFFNWGKTGIYKFGASDKAFQGLRPNNLAMAAAINSLAEAGAETLHFGRSSLLNAGLRRFKLSWGSTEDSLHYYRYECQSGKWGMMRDHTEGFHTEVFRRLPASLNQVAGALIYAHLD